MKGRTLNLVLCALVLAGCQRAFLHELPEREESNVAAGDPPAPPQNVVATPGPTAVTLDWEAGADAQTFNVYWSILPDPRPETGAQTIKNAAKPFVHIGLSPGVTYYYVVTALNASGESDYSSQASAAPNPACAPNARPTDLVGSYDGGGQILLSWSCDATDEDGFVVWRQELGGGWAELMRVGPDAVEAADDNFGADNRYRYRVTAYRDVCETVPTDPVELWTAPRRPEDLGQVMARATEITLSWGDANQHETGYRVERRAGAAEFAEIATLPADSEELVDTGLALDSTYEYRVIALNPERVSAPALATARTSHPPGLTWDGAQLQDTCVLQVTVATDLDAGFGAEASTAQASLELPAALAVGSDEFEAQLGGALEAGDYAVGFTLEDSLGGSSILTGTLELIATDPFVRALERPPSASTGDDTMSGRQALLPVCASCSGRRGAIGAAALTGCILRPDGTVTCWGANDVGELGDGNGALNRGRSVEVCDTGYGRGCGGGAALSGVDAVEVGGTTSCALVDDRVRCWGFNDSEEASERGDGNGGAPYDTTEVCDGTDWEPGGCPTALSGVLQVEVALNRACVRTAGDVLCWGSSGLLGDGETDGSFYPEVVTDEALAPLAGVLDVAVGSEHSCALLADGMVVCWGLDEEGQVGDGVSSQADKLTAVPVCLAGDWSSLDSECTDGATQPRLEDVVDLSAGGSHTCAVLGSGKVRCWGDGWWGQLGYGGWDDMANPVGVCEEGGVWDPAAGCLDGEAAPSPELVDAVAVAAGVDHTCVIVDDGATLDGEVRCFGYEYANGATDETASPVAVELAEGGNLTGVVALTAGDYHTCALRAGGTVRCWGEGDDNRLGLGNDDDSELALPICPLGTWDAGQGRCEDAAGAALPLVVSVSAGEEHTCAALADGTAHCWGSDDGHQLGGGTWAWHEGAVPVCKGGVGPTCAGGEVLADIVALEASDVGFCAIDSAGALLCWGDDSFGQTGAGFGIAAPVAASARGVCETGSGASCVPLDDVAAVDLGSLHACAVRAGGSVWCWGYGYWGALGTGDYDDRANPAPVLCDGAIPGACAAGGPLSGAVGVAVSDYHSCALMETGRVLCWGENSDGELGSGPQASSLAPVGVCRLGAWDGTGCGQSGQPLEGALWLAGGGAHTCAVLEDTTVVCWGYNGDGQLGQVGPVNAANPIPACILGTGDSCNEQTGVIAVSAGWDHSCVLLESGEARCFGSEFDGRLGNGYFTNTSQQPVPLCDSGYFDDPCPRTGDLLAVTVSLDGGCALEDGGRPRCWGGYWSSHPLPVCASDDCSAELDGAAQAVCHGFEVEVSP